MNNEIALRFDTTGVDWTLAADIMQRAPLSSREPHKLEKAFGNSDLVCFAWHGDDLVGMARALSDGVYQSVIYDLCMLPDYQGKHLGTKMIQAMIKRLATPNVVLWAVPGKEGFYARFGFKPMLTAMALVENPERTAEQGYILL